MKCTAAAEQYGGGGAAQRREELGLEPGTEDPEYQGVDEDDGSVDGGDEDVPLAPGVSSVGGGRVSGAAAAADVEARAPTAEAEMAESMLKVRCCADARLWQSTALTDGVYTVHLHNLIIVREVLQSKRPMLL